MVSEFSGPPVRLQLRRTPGFDLQAHSLSINGRPAVNCARPSPCGNPFHHYADGKELSAKSAALLFGLHMELNGFFINDHGKRIDIEWLRRRVRGKNGACFCKVDAPFCHVDTILKVANS